jgi:hypothetical protein
MLAPGAAIAASMGARSPLRTPDLNVLQMLFEQGSVSRCAVSAKPCNLGWNLSTDPVLEGRGEYSKVPPQKN